jgi:glycosyltransferase involved in cell wall biosynthesis
MKLAIFIPAYNEEKAIEEVLRGVFAALQATKGRFPHIQEHKIFVIDDGSTDKTADVARVAGAEVITIKPNRGLANAYKMGLAACLQWGAASLEGATSLAVSLEGATSLAVSLEGTVSSGGADLICHLDADGQYNPAEIPLLLAPIIEGQADFVTGDRQIEKTAFLGPARKYGNLAGSWFLRLLTGLKINDVSCGFRAYNRKTAERLEVYSEHTYTHETLIEAKFKGMRLAQVPISFTLRGAKDKSRLTGNLLKHILSSLWGIFAAYRRYIPV